MNDIPVFAVRKAETFNEQLLASKPDPATGKADPAKMKPFLAAGDRPGNSTHQCQAILVRLRQRHL
jgi:catalase